MNEQQQGEGNAGVSGELQLAAAAAEPTCQGEDRREETSHPTLLLTPQERQWALNIKEAIILEDDLEERSDYWYAQLALTDRDDLPRALERARIMQWFREEYGIDEDPHHGTRIVADFQRVLPEFWMALERFEPTGNWVLALDMAKFYARLFDDQNTRLWFQATYYLAHAMTPDLRSIREGPINMAECQGYDVRHHVKIEILRRISTELTGVYPYNWNRLKNFNTGVFMNTLYALSRRFIPAKMHHLLEMGCQIPGGIGRLDQLYMSPSVPEANRRFLGQVRCNLELRHRNEATFRL